MNTPQSRSSASRTRQPRQPKSPPPSAAARPGEQIQTNLYHWRDKPAKILQVLRGMRQIEAQLTSYRRKALTGYFLFMALLITAGYYLANSEHLLAWAAGVELAIMGLFLVVPAYALLTAILPGKHIRPSSDWRISRVLGAFIFAWIINGPFVSGGEPFGVRFARLRSFVSLFETPGPALIAIAYSTAWVWAFIGFMWLGRLKRGTPQREELNFCATILEKLVAEIPADAVCEVAFNPFHSVWSRFSRPLPGSHKEAVFDFLLTAKLALGNGSRVDILVVHRRTSKGRRKHKGWKHKIKVRIKLSDPRLEQARSVRSEVGIYERYYNEILPTADTALKEITSYGKDLTRMNPIAMREGGTLLVSETYIQGCALSSELSRKLIPHPWRVLASVRAALLTADALTSEAT